MADDPKKKKKAASKGATESGSLAASGPNPVANLTDEEYNRQLTGALEQPAEGEQAKPKADPVRLMWDRFNAVMSKPRDVTETLRGAARGAANVGTELVAKGAELSAGIAGAPDHGKAAAEGAREQGNAVVDAVLGKKSDDGLANFTENATQFVTGFAALPGLPGGKLMGLAKGALVDGTMFDPYEAQLAELVAKSPVPGLRDLGKMLSVSGDDEPTVARIKRAAAGMIPGVIVDGLIAGVRSLRAAKTLAGGATGEAKDAAEAALKDSQKDLERAAEGSTDSHVNVVPSGDGHWSIVPSEAAQGKSVAIHREEHIPQRMIDNADKLVEKLKARDAQEPTFDKDGQRWWATLSPEYRKAVLDRAGTKAGDAVFSGKLNDLSPDAVTAARRHFEEIGAFVRQTDMRARARMDEATADTPVFSSKTEALQQAESMNAAADAQANAGVAPKPSATHDVMRALATGDELPFSVSYRNTVDQDLDLVKTLSQRIIKAQREAVGTEGVLSVENAKAMAKDNLSLIPADKAHETIKGLLKADPESQSVVSVMADMVMGEKGRNIVKLSDVVEARPHDPVALDELSRAIEGYFDLRHSLYGAESDAARRLRFVQEREGMRTEEFDLAKPGEAPVPKEEAPKTPQDGAAPNPEVAGMQTRDASQLALDKANAAAIGRMFKMSGGHPRDTDAILHAATVMQKGGTARAALEVFTNSLLSGPPTWATVSLSGGALSAFEAVTKIVAGAFGKRELAQEGADTLFGLFAHLTDNIRIAAAAMREGRSILNPAPTTYAIGGMSGKVIRAPGNLMLGLDEFTRVSNYRAYIRAKSLRAGRAAGLDGAALAQRIDQDLRASFDPETGIATVPEALKYADIPTLSAPLQSGFGAELQRFTNNALAAKFVVPFIRASTNIFRYTWQSLPGLNLLNSQAREIIKQGGEEAAILHARSMLASTIAMYGFHQALQGNLTGRGPSDPDLRRLWLNDHQPYSIRVGGKWVSYGRLDPISTTLGLIADLNVFAHELGTDHPDFEDGLYAVLGSLVSNMGSKTYNRSITDFAETWGKGDPKKVGRYLQNMVSSMAVPNLANKLNPDPYYREVDGMFDAIRSRLPYFSEKLDPRHNIFGEKVLKTPGYVNRSVNPMTVRDAKDSKVETELLTLGRGLSPAPDKVENGMIDLHDRSFGKPDQPSPYVRMMELVRSPGNGQPSLRDAMEKLIGTDSWKNSSDGTDYFPGGRKLLLAQGLKERYESRAYRQVLAEYPKLREQVLLVRRSKGAAIRGGEEGVAQVESLFGTGR